jgi:hypothetical protein
LVFIALLLSLNLAKGDIHSLIQFPASQVRAPGAPTFTFPLGPRQLCGQPSNSSWSSLAFSFLPLGYIQRRFLRCANIAALTDQDADDTLSSKPNKRVNCTSLHLRLGSHWLFSFLIF